MAGPAEAKAPPKVPASFVGMMSDGPLGDTRLDGTKELDTMVASGVQSLRSAFLWNVAQPYRSFDEVPPEKRDGYRDVGGVPTSFFYSDTIVTIAAARHMSVLPVVLAAPTWDQRHPGEFNSPPKDVKPYAAYVRALVSRYGPNGDFWREFPDVPYRPVRAWQIWNEPSLTQFWSDQPFAKDYVKLLRAAHAAVKGADPGAKVVLAGLPNKSWIALEQIYKAGGRGLFDIATFHPFTATVEGVRTILDRDRKVMARHRDKRKQIWVTELSWTSAKGKTSDKFGNEATEKGQATKLTQAFTMLAKARRELRLGRVYWYTWITEDKSTSYPFDYAGLSRFMPDGSVVRKPAFDAFRRIALKLEHCVTKTRADRCAS